MTQRPETLKRKPRINLSTPSSRPLAAKAQRRPKDAPRTSAQMPQDTTRKNLTLSDWLTVYAFVDSHPAVTQADVVKHFATVKTGRLIFDQSTLSRKLRERPKMEARINDNPAALSSKRPRIVTCPQVEHALVLWVQHMEGMGEVVTGPMLREKRRRFEDELQTPEEERLTGEGWVASFCRTYRLREH
jgi:Tc5 transposase DNA-binding domain